MAEPKFLDRLMAVFEVFSAGCLLVITGLTIAQVIMRYVFNYPFIWSEEVAILAFIYLGFTGIGVAYAQRRHLYIDTLLVTIPKSIVKVINGVVLTVSSLFLVVVIVETIQLMFAVSETGMTTAALELPMAVVHLSVPIGLLFYLIQVLRRFRNLGER
jgi:TRAP-type C4-dicarboxylate transport system permease small subunit